MNTPDEDLQDRAMSYGADEEDTMPLTQTGRRLTEQDIIERTQARGVRVRDLPLLTLGAGCLLLAAALLWWMFR